MSTTPRGAPRDVPSLELTPRPPNSSRDYHRLDQLEERVGYQERTAQALLDRAMKIKEDVINNLNLTHSSWQGEKRQRELLQEHIRAISELVNRLNHDIRNLEQAIRIRDTSLTQIASLIKSLEINQATSVTDLRGRIARCDSSIMKLAADQKALTDSNKEMSTRELDHFQRLQDKIQKLEIKVAENNQKFDRTITQSTFRSETQRADNSSELINLEQKINSMMSEMRSDFRKVQNQLEVERQKLTERSQLNMDKQQSTVNESVGKLESRFDNVLADIRTEIKQMKEEIKRDSLQKQKQQDDSMRAIRDMVRSELTQQNELISKIKSECRQGFSAVYASLTSSKEVLEGKICLSEELMKKELAQIRRMVVLV